ncbi:MAG: tryptophan halogenase family protein [Pseudomonadota bacterium]|jgi:tryptophan halogenase
MSAPVRIVIVGGGTAGWMTAALFSRFLIPGFDIQLVESDDIGTVGVGEATIPQIQLFNAALGIDEDDFLRATMGTIKLAIEFVDWFEPGSRYMHAFGAVGRDVGLIPFHHYWLRAKALGLAEPLGAYSQNYAMAMAGRMQRGPARTSRTLPEVQRAYHFDASLYAAYLRRYAEPRGVRRIEGRIETVDLHPETGCVEALRLAGDRRVEGDVFIDCSGFRGLLIEGALGAGFEDWSRWLPCDRALAVPCASVSPLTPYTRATARLAGWQWRIPLQHRIGNGHVFCSAFMDEDEAARLLLANLDGEPLADPRPIRFKAGMRKKAWVKNVIAVGLSSGFLEPLESTSIHLIQSALSRLLKFLPRKEMIEADIAEYNRQSAFEYEKIRDFIILHYKATRRDDTPFWRACRALDVPDGLKAKLEQFRASGRIFRDADELFAEVGWLQVMVGQGVTPQTWHPLADATSEADLGEYMASVKAIIDRETAQADTHEGFIAKHCAANLRGAA